MDRAETVYGLGAHALNREAVLKIFSYKGRPLTDPLIVHVPSIDAAHQVVEVDTTVRTEEGEEVSSLNGLVGRAGVKKETRWRDEELSSYHFGTTVTMRMSL